MATELARKLRRQIGEPERRMRAILHPLRRQGVHFRRQVHIGSYYADFACHSPAVVIEIDGDTHSGALARSNDAVRDDYFRGRGYRVMRFWNHEGMQSPDGVFREVAAALTQRVPAPLPPPSIPSREGEGDDCLYSLSRDEAED